MRKKKVIITILIIMFTLLLLTVGIAIAIYTSVKEEEESKGLTFYLPRSNSFASSWSYELSDSDVLVEVDQNVYDYMNYRFDYWEFRPIIGAQNKVITIYFTSHYQTEIVEENCFSITYYVDENQGITEMSSENKPDAVNFDNSIENLAWLKTTNSIKAFTNKILRIVIDKEYLRYF